MRRKGYFPSLATSVPKRPSCGPIRAQHWSKITRLPGHAPPHSARGTTATHFRRFRALALFGRRSPRRVVRPSSRRPKTLYGALEVKQRIHAFYFFLQPNFFVRLEAHFFVPARSVQTLSRAGAVKVGRRSDICSCSGDARPHLDSPCARQHARCDRDDEVEGSSLVAHEHSCRNLVFGGPQ